MFSFFSHIFYIFRQAITHFARAFRAQKGKSEEMSSSKTLLIQKAKKNLFIIHHFISKTNQAQYRPIPEKRLRNPCSARHVPLGRRSPEAPGLLSQCRFFLRLHIRLLPPIILPDRQQHHARKDDPYPSAYMGGDMTSIYMKEGYSKGGSQ